MEVGGGGSCRHWLGCQHLGLEPAPASRFARRFDGRVLTFSWLVAGLGRAGGCRDQRSLKPRSTFAGAAAGAASCEVLAFHFLCVCSMAWSINARRLPRQGRGMELTAIDDERLVELLHRNPAPYGVRTYDPIVTAKSAARCRRIQHAFTPFFQP